MAEFYRPTHIIPHRALLNPDAQSIQLHIERQQSIGFYVQSLSQSLLQPARNLKKEPLSKEKRRQVNNYIRAADAYSGYQHPQLLREAFEREIDIENIPSLLDKKTYIQRFPAYLRESFIKWDQRRHNLVRRLPAIRSQEFDAQREIQKAERFIKEYQDALDVCMEYLRPMFLNQDDTHDDI